MGGDERNEFQHKDHKRLVDRLAYHAPEIIEEWLKIQTGTQQKRARRQLLGQGVAVSYEEKLATIGPKTIPHLNLFAHKLTLATYAETTGRPLPAHGVLRGLVLTKEEILAFGIPDKLKFFLGECRSLSQGYWDTRLQFEFRTALSSDESVFQVLARLRHGLVVAGFAIPRPDLAPEETWDKWIRPGELGSILLKPRYQQMNLSSASSQRAGALGARAAKQPSSFETPPSAAPQDEDCLLALDGRE